MLTEFEKRKGKGWIERLNSVKGSIVDFKICLRKLFEAVCSGAKQNQELSTNIGYVLSKLSFQELRVDDIDRTLKK